MAEPTPDHLTPPGPDPVPAPPPRPAPLPRSPRGKLVRWLLRLLLGLVLAGVALLLFAINATRSSAGTAQLLNHIPGLSHSGLRGSLWGGELAVDTLQWQSSNASTRVAIDGLRWSGLRVQPLPQVGTWAHISLATLHADSVHLTLPPADPAQPTVAPAHLLLPLTLDIQALSIGALHTDALGDQPLQALRAKVQLGADFGHHHRLDDVHLRWGRLQVDGAVQAQADAPMTLAATLNASQLPAAPPVAAPASAPSAAPPASAASASVPAAASTATWRAQAQVSGPLLAPQVQATVRGRLSPGQREQALDARATLRPFEAWPLASLSAQAQDFDLSALHSAAPVTALSGQATALTTGRDQPVTIDIDLRNSQPGRWDQARLPVQRLQGAVRGLPTTPNALTLSGLTLQLANAEQRAGTVSGDGSWSRERWTLNLTLADVQPLLLDQRATAMRLGGPIRLSGNGSAQLNLKADLRGQVQQAGTPPVQLQLDASATPLRIELREARAEAGAARALLSGVAQRADAGARTPWALKAQGQLSDFDPLPWWPGPAGSAWRAGPHRFTGTLSADLRLPPAGTGTLRGTQGQAELQLGRSLLAGVPLQGHISLRSASADAQGPAGLQAQARLDAAGNHLTLAGRVAADPARASADRWSTELDAPTLATLAPWMRLAGRPPSTGTGANANTTALSGAVKGSAQVQGRWPQLRSSGSLNADKLQWQGTQVQQASTQWQAGSSTDDPLTLQLQLGPVQQAGTALLESAALQVTGTLRQHRISGRAESAAQPPAWTELLLAPAAQPAGTPRRSVAQLDAHGELITSAAQGPSAWRGTLDTLALHAHGPSATPLVRTQALGLQFDWASGPLRAQVQPGRAELLGSALRWRQFDWQAPGGTSADPTAAQLSFDGELETLAVAPLLARLQPDFGWGGDLQVGAQIKVSSTPQIRADIVFERLSGDLNVTDDSSAVQALGLTDLRVALNAQDHVWSLTQALAGKTLGVAAGAVVARTSPAAPWPGPQTPISGVLEAQVANLGTWGAWVPTGWRLGGTLRTSASLSGRLGAPEYTGEVRGTQISVRNVLQGVNFSDGDIAIALQGARARIEQFKVKAGAGSLSLEGDASLGETPRADLRLLADKVALLGRVDRRLVTSGNARLQLDASTLALSGQFKVDEGFIDFSRGDAPTLADDVVVVRAPKVPERAALPAAADAAPLLPKRQRNVNLDLQLDLGERLRLLGRGLDTGLSGDLRLSTPGGRLAITGTVTTRDGTYAAYGQNLSIDRGSLTFNGPADNPRLDIEATRPNLDIRVGVSVTGTAQSPRVRLFSDPDMVELEKLSWLVMGRASDGLGRADTALLQTAAVALLSGEGDGVTTQFTKAIGLDELSLRQNDTGDVRETVISLGKQLSRRWYVGYERGLNATTGTWQLIYRIAQRFTLRAQSGLDNSLDVIWTWRWQ